MVCGLSVLVPLSLRKGAQSRVIESLLVRKQMEQLLEANSLEIHSPANALRAEALCRYHQSRDYEERITSLVERNLEGMNEAYTAGQSSLNDLFPSQSQRLKIQSAHFEMVSDFEQALVEWKAASARNLKAAG